MSDETDRDETDRDDVEPGVEQDHEHDHGQDHGQDSEDPPGARGGPRINPEDAAGQGAGAPIDAMNAAPNVVGDDLDDRTVMDGHQVEAELLADWRLLFSVLHARFDTGDFATGARLVAAIAEAADAADHHPDVELTYPRVTVRLSSHDVGGVTQRDVRMARTISELAGKVGATPRPEQVSVLELALDTWDHDEIKPFWAALLDYEPTEDDDVELRDPDGTMPTIWFQGSERPEAGTEPEQRWHLDLRVPPETAEARVRRALDAGGTLVSDGRAPTFWVLADAQGNRACVTTWLGRGPA